MKYNKIFIMILFSTVALSGTGWGSSPLGFMGESKPVYFSDIGIASGIVNAAKGYARSAAKTAKRFYNSGPSLSNVSTSIMNMVKGSSQLTQGQLFIAAASALFGTVAAYKIWQMWKNRQQEAANRKAVKVVLDEIVRFNNGYSNPNRKINSTIFNLPFPLPFSLPITTITYGQQDSYCNQLAIDDTGVKGVGRDSYSSRDYKYALETYQALLAEHNNTITMEKNRAAQRQREVAAGIGLKNGYPYNFYAAFDVNLNGAIYKLLEKKKEEVDLDLLYRQLQRTDFSFKEAIGSFTKENWLKCADDLFDVYKTYHGQNATGQYTEWLDKNDGLYRKIYYLKFIFGSFPKDNKPQGLLDAISELENQANRNEVRAVLDKILDAQINNGKITDDVFDLVDSKIPKDMDKEGWIEYAKLMADDYYQKADPTNNKLTKQYIYLFYIQIYSKLYAANKELSDAIEQLEKQDVQEKQQVVHRNELRKVLDSFIDENIFIRFVKKNNAISDLVHKIPEGMSKEQWLEYATLMIDDYYKEKGIALNEILNGAEYRSRRYKYLAWIRWNSDQNKNKALVEAVDQLQLG